MFSDDISYELIGRGNITLIIDIGEYRHLYDVLYVLALKKNILLVGQMMDRDYKVIFDNDKCTIKDKRKSKTIVAKGKMIKDRLFKLVLTPSDTYALKTTVKLDSNLWHRRFGHLNYSSLTLMKMIDMVNRLPNIEVD